MRPQTARGPAFAVPTRQRADLILKKTASHQIDEVALRRL